MDICCAHMKAVFDEARAALISIRANAGEKEEGREFLLTPQEFPEYDISQARWFGNVFLTVSRGGETRSMDTGSSADIRRIRKEDGRIEVVYEGESANEYGISGIWLAVKYEYGRDGIVFGIAAKNPSQETIVLERLGIPLLMNQYFRGDDTYKYDHCVLRHTCITGHHSFLYWAASSGSMPILYVQALGDTPLLHFSCETDDPVFGRRGSMKGTFEGSFLVYPVHEDTKYSHLDCSDSRVVLEPGGEKEFRFFLGMASGYEEMEQGLVKNGGIALKALLGMCVPAGEEAVLLIRSGEMPEILMKEEEDELCRIGEKNGVYTAKLKFNGYGIRNVWLMKGGTKMQLRFFALEQPGEILRKQAEFIADKQYETDESDPCYHGLLMWDMTVRHRVNSSCNPFGPDWFAGGSDEIGLTGGLFLSAWNVYRPDEKQIRVLDGYVRDFLEARLTEQPGSRVHRMVPWFTMFEPWAGHGADDVWRAFNYVHVINTFYHMYLISSKYSYSFLAEPVYYLKRACEYLDAMFTLWMFPDGVGATKFGNMGELILALRLEKALRKEGLIREAGRVNAIVREKAEYFASREYPYGSEMAYDSTAFEAVYAYGRATENRRVMEMSCRVACANRGKQPVWYLYGTDLRQMGDSSWNVSYMTQLGAFPIYDWLLGRGEAYQELWKDEKAAAELAGLWYASYLAGFAIYNSGGFWSEDPENEGASGWIVDGDMGEFTGMKDPHSPYKKGLVPMSGESALGFFGALQIAASAVVDHPVLGRYGFGCRIERETGIETIIPTDGLGIRMHHLPGGWSVVLDRDRIEKAVWDGKALEIWIENLTGNPHSLTVSLTKSGISHTREIELESGGGMIAC